MPREIKFKTLTGKRISQLAKRVDVMLSTLNKKNKDADAYLRQMTEAKKLADELTQFEEKINKIEARLQ